MNDDLQKEINAEIKDKIFTQKSAVDLDEILLKSSSVSIPKESAEEKDKDTVFDLNASRGKPPRSIADVLNIEKNTAINPPKHSEAPRQNNSLKSSKENTEKKPRFFPSSVPQNRNLAPNNEPSTPIATTENNIPASQNNTTKPEQQNSPLNTPVAEVTPESTTKLTDSKSSILEGIKNIEIEKKIVTPIVRKLRTLKGDIEEAMQSGKTSIISIAAAEENRRNKIFEKKDFGDRNTSEISRALTPATTAPVQEKSPFETSIRPLNRLPENKSGIGTKIMGLLLGIILIAGGAGGVYLVMQYQKKPVVIINNNAVPDPLVPSQTTIGIDTSNKNSSYVRAEFDADRKRSFGTLGDIANVVFTVDGSEAEKKVSHILSPEEFFRATGMNPPADLLRTIKNSYMIGIHRYPENQSFMVFETDTYDTAAAAMKNWEKSLSSEVGEFLRSPTYFEYPSKSEEVNNPRVFLDKVVKNQDTRAMYNKDNQILFLYTFINRRYLVFATTADTLQEVINGLARRKTPSE